MYKKSYNILNQNKFDVYMIPGGHFKKCRVFYSFLYLHLVR